MLKRLEVPTRHPKPYLFKYLNKDEILEPPVRAEKRHVPYFSNVLCKFYLKNKCTKGSECIFSHDKDQLNIKTESADEDVTCNQIDNFQDERVFFTSPFR